MIGKNAKLVPESNDEVRAAMESGKPVRSFADLLHEMTAGAETIVAAGSYGKSTCTALLAWCLRVANKDPSYFIGEITNGFDTHAHRGQGKTFVLEGDEYPASNWDNRSKFLLYNAKNVLLTSATHDHINVFPTHADYLAPFRALLGSLPADGLLVVSSEPHARALAAGLSCAIAFYGLDDKATLACRKHRARRGDQLRPDARRRKDHSPVDHNARRPQHRKHRRRQRDAAGEEAADARRS